MASVYLGLGSNIDAEQNLRTAVAALRERFGDLRVSDTYRSAALGFEGDDFLNLVVGLTTDVVPMELIEHFEALHQEAGRVRGPDRFSARPLDIDLLLYGSLVDPEPPLRLPRRDVLEHSFVLRPLAEIAPELVHPVTGRTLGEHWSEYDATSHPLTRVDLIL